MEAYNVERIYRTAYFGPDEGPCPAQNCRAQWVKETDGESRQHVQNCAYLRWIDSQDQD